MGLFLFIGWPNLGVKKLKPAYAKKISNVNNLKCT